MTAALYAATTIAITRKILNALKIIEIALSGSFQPAWAGNHEEFGARSSALLKGFGLGLDFPAIALWVRHGTFEEAARNLL